MSLSCLPSWGSNVVVKWRRQCLWSKKSSFMLHDHETKEKSEDEGSVKSFLPHFRDSLSREETGKERRWKWIYILMSDWLVVLVKRSLSLSFSSVVRWILRNRRIRIRRRIESWKLNCETEKDEGMKTTGLPGLSCICAVIAFTWQLFPFSQQKLPLPLLMWESLMVCCVSVSSVHELKFKVFETRRVVWKVVSLLTWTSDIWWQTSCSWEVASIGESALVGDFDEKTSTDDASFDRKKEKEEKTFNVGKTSRKQHRKQGSLLNKREWGLRSKLMRRDSSWMVIQTKANCHNSQTGDSRQRVKFPRHQRIILLACLVVSHVTSGTRFPSSA